MYNYYTRYEKTEENNIYKDLFLNIKTKFSDNQNYKQIKGIFHENISNVLSTIKLFNGEKKYVKEYYGKTTNTKLSSEEDKNEIINFFNLLNLIPVLSGKKDKNNKFNIIDIYEGKSNPKNFLYYSGYKRIRRYFFNDFLLKLYKFRLLLLKGNRGSGKTSFFFDLIDFLQAEGKLVFYFKTIEQLKKQILNFLFLGESITKNIEIENLLKTIDRDNTFLFIDDYSGDFRILELISNLTESRFVIATDKNHKELKQFKKLVIPPFNLNEIKNIFFWADENKLMKIYNESNGEIDKIKKELNKNYKIALTKTEEIALIDIFLSERLSSPLPHSSINKLLNNNIIKKHGKFYKLLNYDYINKELLTNLFENRKINYDYNKALFIFFTLKDKKKISVFYNQLPLKLKIKLIDKIDLSLFPDNLLRELLKTISSDSYKKGNYILKILSSIKKRTEKEKIRIINEYIRSNDYKKALAHYKELDNIDCEFQLKKIKLLRLTGNILKAIKHINEMKKDILSPSQKAGLQVEEGLSYYSLGEKDKAKIIFQQIINTKIDKKYEYIKNKAMIYVGYINSEEKRKNMNHLHKLYVSYLKNNEFYELGETSSDIGQIYFKKFKLDKALNWFKLSKYYFDKIEHKKSFTLAGFNAGEVLKEKGEFEKAKYLISKAYEIDIETGNSYSLSIDLLSLAEISFFEKKYDLSLKYLKKLEEISPKKHITKSFPLLLEITEILIKKSNSLPRVGIFPEIINNIENLKFIKDTIKKHSDNLMEEIKSVIFISEGCSVFNKKLPVELLKHYLTLTRKHKLFFHKKIIDSIITGKTYNYEKYKSVESFLSDFYGGNVRIKNNGKILFGKTLSENDKNSITIIVNKLLNTKNNNLENNYSNIIGFDTTLRNIKEWADKIKNLPYTVLIYGESGSGKELLSKYIHYSSIRSDKPFISLNCAAIPGELIESLLFGYKKGAFTGANENSKGLIREAEGGTLFLDEIGELPLGMQAKLLRVIQEKEIMGLGENKPLKVDIRFVFATNRDLAEEVKNGKFREDLFYRINELRMNLLPLRERKEDIPILVKHFIEKHQIIIGKENIKIGWKALDILSGYSWKGNIRELETEIKRALIRLKEGEYYISEKHLSAKLSETKTDKNKYRFIPLKEAKEQWEKDYLLSIIKNEKTMSKKQIAHKLGLSRMQLYNLMKKYDIL